MGDDDYNSKLCYKTELSLPSIKITPSSPPNSGSTARSTTPSARRSNKRTLKFSNSYTTQPTLRVHRGRREAVRGYSRPLPHQKPPASLQARVLPITGSLSDNRKKEKENKFLDSNEDSKYLPLTQHFQAPQLPRHWESGQGRTPSAYS